MFYYFSKAAKDRDISKRTHNTSTMPTSCPRRLLMQGTELMDIEKIDSYDLSKVGYPP